MVSNLAAAHYNNCMNEAQEAIINMKQAQDEAQRKIALIGQMVGV